MVERDAEVVGHGIELVVGQIRPYALRHLDRAEIAAVGHFKAVMRKARAENAGVEHRVVRDEHAALGAGRKLTPELRERRRALHHIFLDVVDANVAPVKFTRAGRRL